jgi:hypothetical protein
MSYPSLRYFGWSHQDIINVKNGGATWDDAEALEYAHKKTTANRLHKLLGINRQNATATPIIL